MQRRQHRLRRFVAGLCAVALLTTGCTTAIAGQASRAGAGSTVSEEAPPDGPNGVKEDAPKPELTAQDASLDNRYDQLALATVADLYTFYHEVFPRDFGKEFTPAKHLQSYDSTQRGSACGVDIAGFPNAAYVPRGDCIIWDRGQFMPDLDEKVGILSSPTILAHEMGHLVQARLGVKPTSSLLLEQQADCYAGAYWNWVAGGHSSYFSFSQGAGMRQMLSAMLHIGDPVGLLSDSSRAHGTAFDRTFAAALGYANGPKRCHEISQEEVEQRSQQTGFDKMPTDFGNIDISEQFLTDVIATVDEYFGKTVPGYQPPKLEQYVGTPPACEGTATGPPVDYCPATNTVHYDLTALQKIGTPEQGWDSSNGDFSAVILLVSRYGLAAQATGGGPVSGNNAGLRGLCYAGTWARWMRDPQGPEVNGKGQLQMSPNDLNKAVFEVINSPSPAGDVNGKTSSTVLDQVQALHIGVIYDIRKCFDYYAT